MRDFIRLGGVLFAITAAVALVLAVGNSMTYQKIEDLKVQSKLEAQQKVLTGVELAQNSARELDVPNGTSVTSITVYKTQDGENVFAVSCSPKGYGGEISMMVGVNGKLAVTGVSIIDSANETPGLGARVGEPEFYSQFDGKTKDIIVIKSEPKKNEVQAVTGATISSKAVTDGVNDAIKAVEEVLAQ